MKKLRKTFFICLMAWPAVTGALLLEGHNSLGGALLFGFLSSILAMTGACIAFAVMVPNRKGGAS